MRYSDTDRVYDELLLTRIQAGDRCAGERLAARWYPRLLRDEEQARSAVQEAWSGICRGWTSLRDTSRFPAWAYTILHRKCADRIRQNQRTRAHSQILTEGDDPTVGPRAEDKVTIDQAFALLSDDHRIAAILYFSEGLTLGEIREVTGTPVGTTKSRLFHARKQLKEALSDEFDDEGE